MKRKLKMTQFLMFAGFILSLTAFSSCELLTKKKEVKENADKAAETAKAKMEIVLAEKAITAGKAAVKTAKEKNTRAKEVKVEDGKLIAEALIKDVTDKTAAVTTAKGGLENLAKLTVEQIKTKAETLKQARLDLETATKKLTGKFAALDAEIADSPLGKAQAELAAAEKALTAGKAAVQTAQEKNTKAKEVKVEDGKLIAEALIKAVTGKAAEVTTAKTGLANFEPLTGEQIKTKTAALKQTRLDLEAATANLKGKFAALDAEIAEKEPAMPVIQGEDGKGNPIVVSTKNGKSVSHEDLMKFKNKEENKNKILNTEKINITFDVITPSKVTEFFKNFTHLNIDISNETEVISADIQDPGADGKPQYFKASELAEVIEKINFVENTAGTSSNAPQQISTKASNRLNFEKIKGNIIISDTFSRFEDRELEAFVNDSYTQYDGTVIPRTKSWITFSQLTKLIRRLKHLEFFNNKVKFGDMLVVRKRESDRDVLNCLDMMISENIERFELKNKAGEEYSIKFAGNESIRCYMILNSSNTEINVKQLLQISKRCHWKRQYKLDDGTIMDYPVLGFDSMALRFKSIKNLNCKKLSPDELKDLTFERAWFAGRFEGEDTDLSDISFRLVNTNAAGVVSFTGILPKDQVGANYGYLIIRDAEIPNFDNQDDPIIIGRSDWDSYFDNPAALVQARKGIACLPSKITNLIVHNLKGLDKIAKGFTKKEIHELYGGSLLQFSYGNHNFGNLLHIGDGYADFYAGQYIGSEEAYKEFNRLYSFKHQGYWNEEDNKKRFVCFTDKNNNILKGPYTRTSDKIKKNGNYYEYVEDGELTPIPLTNIRQDEDGFFEEVE